MRIVAPPSSGATCSTDDIAGAAAPPRSTARPAEDALDNVGAVATTRDIIPGDAVDAADPAVNSPADIPVAVAAAPAADDGDATTAGAEGSDDDDDDDAEEEPPPPACALLLLLFPTTEDDTSHIINAELTHVASDAAARPPIEHTIPRLAPTPPGNGTISFPMTVTGVAPPPAAAGAAAGTAANTLGRGANITCPVAAPAASPPAHNSVTVANPAPVPSGGIQSAECPREDAAAADDGNLAPPPPPLPTTHHSGRERGGNGEKKSLKSAPAGVGAAASAAPTAGPPTNPA